MMTTTVQLLQNAQRPVHMKWLPTVGSETQLLMSTLRFANDVSERAIESGANIIAQCIDPQDPVGNVTGLVVGYVQSGKTVSFTTVSALARDNGFRVVIVIAGTTLPLIRQSRARLEKDLSIHRTESRSPWLSMPDPTIASNSHITIRDVLEQWDDPDAPANTKRTLFITVMKDHRHLEKLVKVLKEVPLDRVPVLIIDDEGDQAGLNAAVRKGAATTTYQKLLQLRTAVPNHAYLEYTATPQALLLINIMDWLSADFAEVLIPGEGYIGGKELFCENSPYVEPIPLADSTLTNQDASEPPDSLLSAIRIFLLGCAAHALGSGGDRRSMMIHPSTQRNPHREYFNWTNNYYVELKALFARPDGDAARDSVFEEFRKEYTDLARTVVALPKFEALMKAMKSVLRESRVMEFNAVKGKTPEIHWDQHMYWILIGGFALDRGFTVEGLTVTYMPRGIGVGNADNLQQRGRFFGYKKKYLDYCRVYLEADVQRAFKEYVESEEDIREQLQKFRGKSLTEWRRNFVQTRFLRPTRREVVDIDYQQITIGSDWVYPERSYENPNYVMENQHLFEDFIQKISWEPSDFLDDRGESSARNLLTRSVSLDAIIDLLAAYRTADLEDSAQLVVAASLLQRRHEKHPNETATVIYISGGETRFRGLDDEGKISQLFQGAQFRGNGSSKLQVYLAEREMRDSGRVTVHLSYLNLGGTPAAPQHTKVPNIAVYLQDAKSYVNQDQGGS